jgi:hypothetical protein
VKRIYVSDPAQYLNPSNIPLNTVQFGTSRFSFRVPAPATTIAISYLARFKPEDYVLLASVTPNPLPVGPFWVGNHLVPFMQTWQDRDIVTKEGIIA